MPHHSRLPRPFKNFRVLRRPSDSSQMRSSGETKRNGEAPGTVLFLLRVCCLPSDAGSHLLDLPHDAPANVMILQLLNSSQPPPLYSTSA